jgi:hypothetical protein
MFLCLIFQRIRLHTLPAIVWGTPVSTQHSKNYSVSNSKSLGVPNSAPSLELPRHQLQVIMARIFTRVSFLTTVFVLSIVRNMISPGQGRKSTTWKAIFQHEPWLGVSVVRGCAPSPFLHHHIKEEARRACKPTFVVHQCRPQNPTHWTDLGRRCSGGKPSVTP